VDNKIGTTKLQVNSERNNINKKSEYVSEVCALSYLKKITHKGPLISKKKVSEIHSLVSSYLNDNISFPRQTSVEINIKTINDLTIFFFSQYIDMRHDTKHIPSVPNLNSFGNFLTNLVLPSIQNLNPVQKNIIPKIITGIKTTYIKIIPDYLQQELKSKFEDQYYKFILEKYNLKEFQVPTRSSPNINNHIVFDQSNTNEGRILSSRYQIVLPIPSLADAGIFTNPECHFWKDLTSYIRNNIGRSDGYRENFNSSVHDYIIEIGSPNKQVYKIEAENFINDWIENNNHLKHNAHAAFKHFLVEQEIRIGTIKLPPGQSKPVMYRNPRPVAPCFDKFEFVIKYENLTIMKAVYDTHDMSKLKSFEKEISKKDLNEQIKSLRGLFTKGLYNIKINNIPSSVKSVKEAYQNISIGTYQKLLEKHLGDIGPQVWALAHNTYYSTGDRSGVCQYLVLANLINKPEVKGPFFEKHEGIVYIKNDRMKYTLTKSISPTTRLQNEALKGLNQNPFINNNNKRKMTRFILTSPNKLLRSRSFISTMGM